MPSMAARISSRWLTGRAERAAMSSAAATTCSSPSGSARSATRTPARNEAPARRSAARTATRMAGRRRTARPGYRGPAAGSGEVRNRIDRVAVHPHLEVEMATGRVASGAHVPDRLAPAHVGAGRNRERRLVRVRGGQAVPVVDDREVAVAPAGARGQDPAVVGGPDRLAARPPDVHPRVEPPGAEDGMRPPSEPRDDGPTGRPEQLPRMLAGSRRPSALDDPADPGRLGLQLGDGLLIALPVLLEVLQELALDLDLQVDLVQDRLLGGLDLGDPGSLLLDDLEPLLDPFLDRLDPLLPVPDELLGHLQTIHGLGVDGQHALDEGGSIGQRADVIGAQQKLEVGARSELVRGGGPLLEDLALGPELRPGPLQLRGPPGQLAAGHLERGLHLGQPGLGVVQPRPELVDPGGQLLPLPPGLPELGRHVPALFLDALQLVALALELVLDPVQPLPRRRRRGKQ